MSGWRTGSTPSVALALLAALVCAPPVASQAAPRLAGIVDGSLRMAYPARPDVEVCDHGVRRGAGADGRWVRDDAGACWTDGMVRVELQLRDGVVRDVRLLRPSDLDARGGDAAPEVVDAREAVDLLLGVARDATTGRASSSAVFPAVAADVPEIWRDLLALARDGRVHVEARKAALFWSGQEAAETVTAELSAVALGEDGDREVRKAAIFALSQRPVDQAVDALMEVGLRAEDPEARRSAMFWLAQMDDPRVISFFEEVLSATVG